LINNLENSQKFSHEIREQVAIAKVTEAKINEASEFYRPAAVRGGLIFFVHERALQNQLFLHVLFGGLLGSHRPGAGAGGQGVRRSRPRKRQEEVAKAERGRGRGDQPPKSAAPAATPEGAPAEPASRTN
jgi:hypothetical protein